MSKGGRMAVELKVTLENWHLTFNFITQYQQLHNGEYYIGRIDTESITFKSFCINCQLYMEGSS